MKQTLHPDLRGLREFALSFPGAFEDFPFGHSVIKVGKKIFVFLGSDDEGRGSMAVKLPASNRAALRLECARPTEYGLGKSGWVSVSIDADDTPDDGTLRSWIDESYRAVAPKKLAAQIGGVAAVARSAEPARRKSTSATRARAGAGGRKKATGATPARVGARGRRKS